VAGQQKIEVIGPDPWPAGFAGALPRYASIPVTIMITPRPHTSTTIADLAGHAEAVVWASDPSAIEAAVLIAAGASAYVTELEDLAVAVQAVSSGEAWLAPVAAAAVCRLARVTRDPGLSEFAVAARAAASGMAWPLACGAAGVTQTRSLLMQLRRQL
jgi:DNA-binding NarL/FixJ family response regulator